MRTPRSASKLRSIVASIMKPLVLRQTPIPVTEVANGLGAEVVFKFFPKNIEMSGMLFRDTEGLAIIAVNSRHSENRQRFTIAHEIGHLVLHKGRESFVDRSFRVSVNRRDHNSSNASSADEIEANRFAAELLMPYDLLIEDLSKEVDVENEKDIVDLAEKYEVSQQAMTLRILNLLKT